jgi:hypothetical protein
MHTLVQMLYLSRKEFERNLVRLSDEDARKHIQPMNCISWIIGHVACQHRAYFIDWPAGRQIDSRYLPYGYGAPASEPPLDEVMSLWRDACNDSKAWLEVVTNESLQDACKNPLAEGENWGALLVRCIFHTWCHLGEISSIRQVLGHKPPQFVNMHGWVFS